MLVRLLGVNLCTDELPGSALIPVDADMQNSSRKSLHQNSNPERNVGMAKGEDYRAREQRNLKRIEQVFTQLSNNSGQY